MAKFAVEGDTIYGLGDPRYNMKKKAEQPTIVEFMDGTYGVRKVSERGTPSYFDTQTSSSEFWWTKNSEYFKACKVKTMQEAEENLERALKYEIEAVQRKLMRKDMGKPIKSKRHTPARATLEVEVPEPEPRRKLPLDRFFDWMQDYYTKIFTD